MTCGSGRTSRYDVLAMKHTTPILALVTLVAASASAQSSLSSRRPEPLSYDRVGVSYAKCGDVKYTTVATSAALGEYLTASANYVDVGGDVAGFSLDGRVLRVGLGARFNTGYGMINVGYAYGIGAVAAGGLGDIGEQDAFFLGYRQAFARDFEFAIEVSHLQTTSFGGDLDVTPITLSVRYNIGKVDITAAFSTEDAYGLQDNENTFSLGVGVSF